MVYVMAARKTASFMIMSMVISLAIVLLISGDLDAPTGRATTTVESQAGTTWMIFLLGLFVGALIVGTYIYVTRLEAKRKE